jgi:Aldo/keto reductase family
LRHSIVLPFHRRDQHSGQLFYRAIRLAQPEGNGESEKNLGRVLQSLKPANVAVGTKVRLASGDFGRMAEAVAKSLEGSLARLRLDRIDIFHLHNAITETGGGETLSVRQVPGDVVPAFERLRQQDKTRFLGLTAIGDMAALHQVVDARAFDSAQVVYNMLNPSAAALPANYPAEALWTAVRSYDRGRSPSSASACSLAACPARPSVIRLRVLRPRSRPGSSGACWRALHSTLSLSLPCSAQFLEHETEQVD